MSNTGREPGHSTTITTTHNSKAHQKDDLQELLFINHFSNKRGQTHQRPDRRTTSSYVQRHIHRAKRMQNSFKLLRPESPNTIGIPGQNITTRVQSSLQNSQLRDGQSNAVSGSFSTAYPPMSRATFFDGKINDLAIEDCQHKDGAGIFVSVLARDESCPLFSKYAGIGSADFLDGDLSSDFDTSRIFDIMMPSLEKECLRFYLEILIPKILLIPSIAKEHCHWVEQAANSSEQLLYAIAALSSALFATKRQSNIAVAQEHHVSSSMIGELSELWFKAHAVRLVNSNITDTRFLKSGIIVYAITCLQLATIITGNLHEMATHTFGLKTLLELPETYSSLPLHAITVILSTLYIACTIDNTPPIPTPLVATGIGEVQAIPLIAFETYPILGEIGEGFNDSNFTRYLGQYLTQAYSSMRAVVILMEYLRKSQRAPTTLQKSFYHYKVLNCHFLATQSVFEDDATDIQEPLRLALLIFWNATTQLNASMLYRTLAIKLKTSLEATKFEIFWASNTPILLWMLLLGAFISRGQLEYTWFISQMTEISQRGGIKDWLWLQAMLQRFFYFEGIFEPSFTRSWEEAHQGRTFLYPS